MRPLRLLVCEGNSAEHRRSRQAAISASDAYADTLRGLAPGSAVDVVCAADAGALPPAPLASYDGVAITGSALNIWRAEPESMRQIAFARAVFATGVPFFGSCWGLQVATVAAGGEVVLNPRGREVAFARKVFLTAAGLVHPMHAGRLPAFDAPAIHGDMVGRLPDGATATAWNSVADIQAAEIRSSGGVFWGVQYHPEFGLDAIADVVLRYGSRLVDDGFFADLPTLHAYAADLKALDADVARFDIAWRLGLGSDILEPSKRLCEIANWLTHQVRPAATARLRT